MNILLVSEGPHELGDEQQVGALEILVRRILDVEIDCTTARVSSAAVRTHRGKGKGYFKRAVRWIREAHNRGYDAIVLLIDRDKYKERIGEIDEAQQYTGLSLPRALGVAVRSFDAWMLADETALTQVLGLSVDRQPEPESLTETDAKERCRDLCERSEHSMSQSQLYVRVAEVTNLDVLGKRCRSFSLFAERVKAIPT